MTDETHELEQLRKERDYYKQQLDEVAGENVKLDQAIAGIQYELKQKRQGFTLLSELQQSIGGHQDVSSIFEITAQTINGAPGIDKTVILTPTNDEYCFRPGHWYGFHQTKTEQFPTLSLEFPPEFSEGTGLLMVTKSTEKTLLIEKLQATFELPFFICLPIMVDNAPIGLLLTGRLRDFPPYQLPFNQGDVDTFQAIVGLISASVRNMRIAVLEEMDRLKTEFFSNMSHEFRTPITLTIGPLEGILTGRYGEVSDAIRNQALVMIRNQERLLDMVNQNLELAKLEAGGMQLRAAPMPDMSRFVEKRVHQFHSMAEKRGVELKTSLEPLVEVSDLFIDQEKFDKVLFNLLSNAIKFTKQGTVEVSTEIQEEHFCLTVTDTGVGIKADQLPHIFDRFRQAAGSETREYAGTGIGLALVKEIVELHGGNITAHSQYGKGTSFRVSIPLGKAHLDPASIVEFAEEDQKTLLRSQEVIMVPEGPTEHEGVDEANQAVETAFDPEKPTVLYTEDNPDLRNYVRDLLSAHYNVFLAVDGQDGLEKARKYKPGLILTDYMMPHMSGADLLQATRSEPELRSIPVILLTARAGSEARIESLEAGADDYLTKPFDEDELLARIRNLLKARAQEQELAERTHELTQTLEHLRATQDQLVEAEKMAALGGLVAGVAHEINTPVGVGVTAASLLEDKTAAFRDTYKSGQMKRTDLEKYLNTAEQSSQMILKNLSRAANLIQSFKQVAVDQSSEERREFLVKEYLEEILLSLRPQLKKTQHTIKINGNDELTLDSYPGAFSQIVTNLVMNSLIHAYEPEEAGQLSFGFKQANDHLTFEYSDDGRGISQENVAKIFDPFFTTKRGQGGSGLGLHIIYNLVTQKLGGTIRCESEIGKGTEFIISLPLKRETINGQ